MRKACVVTAVFLALAASPALAQDRAVPAGDQLDQTPPADITRQQLQAAPSPDQRTFNTEQGRPPGAPLVAPK